jgi:hypothetical protein
MRNPQPRPLSQGARGGRAYFARRGESEGVMMNGNDLDA